MAAIVARSRFGISLGWKLWQPSSFVLQTRLRQFGSVVKNGDELTTHTGQVFHPDDYRRARFIDQEKLVNERFAIDLIREDPVVVCTERVVSSNSGSHLGHPKVFINLDPPGIHTCGYSGTKFVLKKYYDEKSMGPSITYDEYLGRLGD